MKGTAHFAHFAHFGYDRQLMKFSISLILFFDAAHLSNAIDGKVWAVLAIILNLPLVIRQAHLNVIPLVFWRGHIVNSFNGIFKHHMQEFVDILTNGILIEIGTASQMLNVYVHILIGIFSLFPYNYFLNLLVNLN